MSEVLNRRRPTALPATTCPPEAMRLIERCWAHEPQARPSMLEVARRCSLSLWR